MSESFDKKAIVRDILTASGAAYFSATLRTVILPTYGVWPPPLAIWFRFADEAHDVPVHLLTPATLAFVMWKCEHTHDDARREAIRSAIRPLLARVDSIWGSDAIRAAVADLEATGQPPDPLPSPEPGGNRTIWFSSPEEFAAMSHEFLERWSGRHRSREQS